MITLRSFANYLSTTEIFLAAAAVAAAFVTDRALLPALIVLALYWPIRWLAHGRPSVRTPVDWPILFLAGVMVPVTLWATALPELTQPQVMRLLSGVGLAYALVNWSGRQRTLVLPLAGLLAFGVALALAAPFTVQWKGARLPFIPAALYNRFVPLVADTINANVLGGTLLLILPVVLALVLTSYRTVNLWMRGLFILVAGLMGGMLVLSQSRGALTGLAAALAVLAILSWRKGWLLVLLVGLGGGAAISLIGVDVLFDAAGTTGPVTADVAFGGLAQRVEIWSRAIYMIQDFSFTGVGMGSFGKVADLLYPFFLAAPGTIPHAHDLFFQVAVDLGIPGLIAWLATLLLVMAAAWQLYRTGRARQDGWVAALGAGFLASQVGMMVHGLTDATVWGMIKPAVVVWAVWGLTLAAHRIYVVDGVESRPNRCG